MLAAGNPLPRLLAQQTPQQRSLSPQRQQQRQPVQIQHPIQQQNLPKIGQFSILTSNVLREDYYKRNFNPSGQYQNNLNIRSRKFLDSLMNLKPNIIALQ